MAVSNLAIFERLKLDIQQKIIQNFVLQGSRRMRRA